MRYFAAGIAIVIAFVSGTVVCAYLPLGYLENGVTVSELKLSRVNLGGRPYYALTGYPLRPSAE